jgi:hypothetical protein
MNNIRIIRDCGFADSLRDYIILIDGQEELRIAQGGEREFHLDPGVYFIQAKIDWCKTTKLDFEVKQNENKCFLVESNLRGTKNLLALWLLFFPSKWLKLREIKEQISTVDALPPSVRLRNRVTQKQ